MIVRDSFHEGPGSAFMNPDVLRSSLGLGCARADQHHVDDQGAGTCFNSASSVTSHGMRKRSDEAEAASSRLHEPPDDILRLNLEELTRSVGEQQRAYHDIRAVTLLSISERRFIHVHLSILCGAWSSLLQTIVYRVYRVKNPDQRSSSPLLGCLLPAHNP